MSRNKLILPLLLAFLWPVTLSAQLQPPERKAQAWTRDDQGRRFRVSFPRHDRISFLVATYPGQDVATMRFALEPKLEFEANFADEEIWWRMRHRFFFAQALTKPADGANIELELVRARYLRHDMGSYILIPIGQNDIKLPAPFDIAVDYRIAKLRIDTTDELELKRLDVLEVAPMADWIRDNAWRHRFAVGPLARYRVAFPAPDTVEHQFAPFTGGRVLYGYETRNGIFAFRLNVDVFNETRAVVDQTVERSWIIETEGNVEWIPFAINNKPVSLVGRGLVRSDNGDVSGSFDVGLRLSFSLQ